MPDSELPNSKDANIYTVIFADIYLKNLFLQDEAAVMGKAVKKAQLPGISS